MEKEKRTTFTINSEVAKRFRIFAIQNDYPSMAEAVEKALEKFMKEKEDINE